LDSFKTDRPPAAARVTAEDPATVPQDQRIWASPMSVDGDMLTFRDILAILWRNVPLLILLPVLAAALATYSLKGATPIYTATLSVAGISQDGGARGGLGALVQSLGISTDGGSSLSRLNEYRYLITSVTIAKKLDEEYGMVREVFAGEWDKATGRWREPRYRGLTGLLIDFRRALGLPVWSPPDVRRLSEYLQDTVKFGSGSIPEIFAITYDNKDPEKAVEMLRRIHATAEEIMRIQLEKEYQSQVDYLNQKLRQVHIRDHRNVLIELLAKQEQQMMLLRESVPIGVRVVDGPVTSVMPTSPRPILTLGLAIVVGLAIALMLAVVREAIWPRRRQPAAD